MNETLTVGQRTEEKFERALTTLRKDGYCTVEGVISVEELDGFRASLDRLAKFEHDEGWIRSYAYDGKANTNHRIWNLISRDPVFCRLVEHEMALRFVREMIGWPALLSSTAANIANKHGEDEVLHCDQACSPEPWDRPHGINVVWCIDDFTADNGATRVAPGSHLLNRSPREGEDQPEFVPLLASAGSIAVMDGRCWHHTGKNLTDAPRRGIFNWYTLPIYLPQENWFLSLNPAIRQFGSETLQTLLGFRPGILGRVNGLEPGSV